MKKTTTRLADGRELRYFDRRDDAVRTAPDERALPDRPAASEIRYDPLLADWVAVTAHRQQRTHLPPADQCPLCPSRSGRRSEIPADDYDVVVFENRFPSFAASPASPASPAFSAFSAFSTFPSLAGGPVTEPAPAAGHDPTAVLQARRPAAGRSEVVCFTADHDASFADLTEEQAALVLAAWTDRTADLLTQPGVQQVFCFENRGREIGVTLGHPHGQIYAYPFVTPRTERMLRSAAAYRRRTGGNLFDDILAAERADGARIVLDTGHWTAFVPHAAHWPYEVHLYPRHRVPDLPSLDEATRVEFPSVYLELLRRFDRIFGPDDPPTPYVAAWHQAPVGTAERDGFALHLELFTVRRASGKLKYLAGSESGMDAFVNDVRPEAAADRLREVAST